MELDTGAAVSVITQRTYQKIVQQNHIQPLQQSDLKLKSYSGETIPCVRASTLADSTALQEVLEKHSKLFATSWGASKEWR